MEVILQEDIKLEVNKLLAIQTVPGPDLELHERINPTIKKVITLKQVVVAGIVKGMDMDMLKKVTLRIFMGKKDPSLI